MARIELRTGWREVPDHIADMLADVETYRLTYEEAINVVNSKMLASHMEPARQRLLAQHFKERPWER